MTQDILREVKETNAWQSAEGFDHDYCADIDEIVRLVEIYLAKEAARKTRLDGEITQ